MTSKIHINAPVRKIPQFYEHGNIIGTVSVHSGKKKLKSRRFYSSSARKMIMDDWKKEYKGFEIYFLIRLDKIPE